MKKIVFALLCAAAMAAALASCGSSPQSTESASPYYCDGKFSFEKHKYLVFKQDGDGGFCVVHDPDCGCGGGLLGGEWLDSYSDDEYLAKMDSLMNLIETSE